MLCHFVFFFWPLYCLFFRCPGDSISQVAGSNNSYRPITNTAWVRARLCKLQKGCTRLAAASDKDYPLLAHGRWFSPGTPASSTTKTGRHDIAAILLKVALKHQKSNQSLSVVLFTASDCSVGIFTFWPLYCLFFELRLLIVPLVSFGQCIVCSLIYGF